MQGEKALDFTVASIALLGIAGCTVIFLVSRRYKHIPVAAFVALALCCALGLSLYFFASSFSRARDLIAAGIGGALFTVFVYALMSGLSARRAAQSASAGKSLVEFVEAPDDGGEDAGEAWDEKRFEGLLTEADEAPKKLWEEEEDEQQGLSFENELIEAAVRETEGYAPKMPAGRETESLAAAEELFSLAQALDEKARSSELDAAPYRGAEPENEPEDALEATSEDDFEEYAQERAYSSFESFRRIDLPFAAALDERERKEESDAVRAPEDDAPFIPLFDFLPFEPADAGEAPNRAAEPAGAEALFVAEEPVEASKERSSELEEEPETEDIKPVAAEEGPAIGETGPAEVETPARAGKETVERGEEPVAGGESVEETAEQAAELEEEPAAEDTEPAALEEEPAIEDAESNGAEEGPAAGGVRPVAVREPAEDEPCYGAKEGPVEPEAEIITEIAPIEEEAAAARERLSATPDKEARPSGMADAGECAALPDERALKEEAMESVKASVAGGRYEEALTRVFTLLRAGYALDENEKRRLLIIMKLLKEKGL